MVPDESLAGCVVLTISVTHSVGLPSPSLSFPFMHGDHPLQFFLDVRGLRREEFILLGFFVSIVGATVGEKNEKS